MALGSICGTTFKKKENDFYDYRAHWKVQHNLHIGLFRLTAIAKLFLWLVAQYLRMIDAQEILVSLTHFALRYFLVDFVFEAGSHYVVVADLEHISLSKKVLFLLRKKAQAAETKLSIPGIEV